MKVKSKDTIKKNFEQSTTLVTERYKDGVSTADWKEDALKGQELYVTRMQDPKVLERRNKGINRISDEEWRKNAIDKGSNVIAARMKKSSGKQADRFEPYRVALENMTLPDKTADPAQNVMNRVIPIAVKFRDIKDSSG